MKLNLFFIFRPSKENDDENYERVKMEKNPCVLNEMVKFVIRILYHVLNIHGDQILAVYKCINLLDFDLND